MVGELITLPLRVGVRATQLWLRVAEETFAVAKHASDRLIGGGSPAGSDASDDEDWSVPSPPRADLPATRSNSFNGSEKSHQPPRPPAPDPAPPTEQEPPRVSKEPELVAESADPGAQDGAGAEVRVDPPWDGYQQMNAKRVIARLASASTAELAAVQLYESGNRGRQTILNAVERELRSANGRNSPS